MLKQTFTINPVGQGLFYTGEISTGINNKPFRFVFDCGSFNKANCLEEVANYRKLNLVDQQELDLLIISHFDADHINHIGKLLEGNIKVKKLVMPFLTFEERLFLVLRFLSPFNGQSFIDDDFPVRFIIDPLGTLSGNLDNDSEVFLIVEGPISPTGIDNSGEEFSLNSKFEEGEELKFSFHAPKKLESSDNDDLILGQKNKGSIFKIRDNDPGTLKYSFSNILVMQFIFYKRSLGQNEEKFYKNVYQKFCERHGINNFCDHEEFLKQVIEKLMVTRSGRSIREIFSESAQGIAIQTRGRAINDLNTTSLCLLHINNEQFIKSLLRQHRGRFDVDSVVKFLQKPDGSRATYFTVPVGKYHDKWRGPIFSLNRRIQSKRFPNTLLTSDCFLSEQKEVVDFYNKFSTYWSDFWLFQIPHHGSKRSSDRALFSRISSNLYLFINYGVKKEWPGKWRHPSAETIVALTETGHSSELMPINEFFGIQFLLEILAF